MPADISIHDRTTFTTAALAKFSRTTTAPSLVTVREAFADRWKFKANENLENHADARSKLRLPLPLTTHGPARPGHCYLKTTRNSGCTLTRHDRLTYWEKRARLGAANYAAAAFCRRRRKVHDRSSLPSRGGDNDICRAAEIARALRLKGANVGAVAARCVGDGRVIEASRQASLVGCRAASDGRVDRSTPR